MTDEPPTCPACGGLYSILLGILGRLAHLRCRACGMTYNVDAAAIDDPAELEEATVT